MRILHTSDWHLGQEFHSFGREQEHAAFLGWLEDALVTHQVDAMVVAGDIYDSQHPPIAAQKQLYQFIARIRQRLPELDIVLVGGNHDSAGRLEAPGPLLEVFGVRVIGSMTRLTDGTIDVDRLSVPLHDSNGNVAAVCAAIPFLRISDIPPTEDDGDGLIEGVRQIYAEVLDRISARLVPGQALVVTGHCYMSGSELSELSERRILGGNQHALPVDIFPESATYVALGHLHKAQMVGGREQVRYSGSPMPMSVTERDYRHQVLLVDVEGPKATITSLPIPRWAEIIRIPAQGATTPEDAKVELKMLVADANRPRDTWPYLHVSVTSDGPVPGLRRDVEEAIIDKGIRLARIDIVNQQPVPALAIGSMPDLDQVHPEEIFRQCWRGAHQSEPPQVYLDAFRQLLESLESGEVSL